MSVFTRPRARDGATVYYIRHRVAGRQIVEKVGALPPDALKRQHETLRVRAQRIDQDRRLAIDNGTWVDPIEVRAGRLTFGQLVKRFLSEYRPRSGEIAYYTSRSIAWLKHLDAARPARSIGIEDLDRFRRERERDVGPSTVHKDLVSFGTMFRWAEARHLVASNPANPSRVARPAEHRHRAGYLTEDQEKLLLEKCATWLRSAVTWAICSGMDREEVVTLSWRDVDETAGVVWAPRARTGAPRQMPLNDRLRAVLEQARRVRSVTDGGRVFLDARGRPLGLSSATGALARAYRDAQLEVAGPWKILRHTFGSRLAMARVAPQAIAALMGHTTMAVTQCYVHLSPGFLRGALDPGEKSPQKAPGDAADGTWGGVLDSFHVKRLALRAISA